MFGIGTGELLLLLVIALIVLGPERMPQVARDLGRIMNDLRRTSDELQRELLNADHPAPPPPPPAPEPPTAVEPPSAGAAPAEVTTPTEPAETEFDREARLARERLEENAKRQG
ncbi:MAG: twin-arginine translocase TatA/TatE family subunit [Chloroflexota bacterium]|nr:twin-arginine translocase TatA/TatE family subunit [Chloroflexota bacterium]MDE3192741.1 twin-arginine translocase TatA/TatE family subunit [Chloroflexota bacterium]